MLRCQLALGRVHASSVRYAHLSGFLFYSLVDRRRRYRFEGFRAVETPSVQTRESWYVEGVPYP